MSTLHTLNGRPVTKPFGDVDWSAMLDAETLALIDSYDWDGSGLIHNDAIEVVALTLEAYRKALRDALAMLDASRFGARTYRCLTPIEEKRLEEIRKLVSL